MFVFNEKQAKKHFLNLEKTIANQFYYFYQGHADANAGI